MEVEGLKKEEMNPQNFGGMCSREALLKTEQEIDFTKGLDAVATTSAPALVVDWENWRIIREVLPMRYYQPPDDGETTLLDTHARYSIEKVYGYAKDYSTTDNELMAKIFVSETETKVRQKIKERVIKKISLGYQTKKSDTVEIPKNKEEIGRAHV